VAVVLDWADTEKGKEARRIRRRAERNQILPVTDPARQASRIIVFLIPFLATAASPEKTSGARD
jgi:hypothetical protein